MFKICNDKTYYVVQTISEDVVVEIYTKKDGRGSGISLHEMHLDLCRAIRKLQHDGNKTLDDAIHECRWAILKDALMQRGHDAVADFIGTDVSSDSYERLLDETEAQMPSEEFEKFWERYI